ncbi:MAG: penicillin acylase family protein [bacterium]
MKKVLLGALVVLIILLIGIFIVGGRMISSGLAKIDGTIEVPGLKNDVTVLRDDYGVPHIFAKDEEDAYFAMGYVHAQDRIFQMDLFRRKAEGRLAEIVGDANTKGPSSEFDSILEGDIFSRVIGFWEMGRRHVETIPEPAKTIMRRYVDGVNAWIGQNEKNLPLEFAMLQYKMEFWTVEDIIAISRMVAWDLSANAMRELMRYEAVARFGRERGWELYPRHLDEGGPYAVPPSQKKYEPRGKVIEDKPAPIPEDMLEPDFFGALGGFMTVASERGYRGSPAASNNWVVSGKKSKSGKPILCNDPHLPHLLPSVFYLAHLRTEDGLDVIGVTFPGVPFVVLGHNRDVAWAATTTRTDTQDLFVEMTDEDHPGRYLYKGEWLDFETREEEILVKSGGEKEVRTVTVRSTVHGPVLNDMLPERYAKLPPVALKWAAYEPSDDYLAFMGLSRAKNAGDVREALAHIGAPIQSWVFADKEGRTGFFPAGLVPIRKKGDGTMPVPGWTGEYDWGGYIPFDELPQLYDPEEGFIITANNQIVPEEDYPYHYSYYYMMYRAQRIRQLLTSKEKLSVDDMKEFQTDNYSCQAARLRDVFVGAYDRRGDKKNKSLRQAVEVLKKWNLETDVESIGASIFTRAYYEAMKMTLEDEVSGEMLKDAFQPWRTDSTFDRALETGEFSFFDDVRTPEKEGRDDVLAASLEAAVEWLTEKFGEDKSEWKWGSYHLLDLHNEFAGLNKPMEIYFGQPKVPLAGTGNTVDAESFAWSDDVLLAMGGPAMRHIVDMARVEDAVVVIDSGQSGHPKSPHYRDQVELWRKGGYIPMWMDEDDIRVNLEGELLLRPMKR